jgi:hypothetical protein
MLCVQAPLRDVAISGRGYHIKPATQGEHTSLLCAHKIVVDLGVASGTALLQHSLLSLGHRIVWQIVTDIKGTSVRVKQFFL